MQSSGSIDHNDGALTKDERELIRLWRNADERGRRAIMRTAEVNQGWDESGNFRILDGRRRRVPRDASKATTL